MSPRQSIAHYKILTKLGEGGMGAVYRATDTKLNRDVAVKILPDQFAASADRMARFTREAQVLAALDHPGIAVIYGVEERALVMELVEGPTLADRLAKGKLSIEESLAVVRQIAEALEHAHAKGVIHRDLKPANIKFTKSGRAKLLDFGLAKALDPLPSSDGSTVTMDSTIAGFVMGTPGYMSPEQAAGKPVDKRTDTWAFGVVLYEILSGRRPDSPPDWTALPAATPPNVRRLLRHGLQADPANRLRDIGDARILLDEPPEASAARASNLELWAHRALSAVLLAILAATAFRTLPSPTGSDPTAARFTFSVTAGAIPTSAPEAVPSPDGGTIVTVTFNRKSGKQLLGLRNLRSLAIRELEQTEGARWPFWSPDGTSIGFFADGKLKAVSLATGVARTLCNVSVIGEGAAWGREGAIVFAGDGGPLMKVPAAGGEAKPVTSIDSASKETGHTWPVLLPDGRILFLAIHEDRTKDAVYAQEPGEGRPRTLVMKSSRRAVFAPPNYLLYTGEGILYAQRLDIKTLQLQSEPVRVAENVGEADRKGGASSFAVSDNGVLVYRERLAPITRQLAWYDRRGNRLKLVGPPGGFTYMNLSPDEQYVAATGVSEGRKTSCLWLLSLKSDGIQCITPEAKGLVAIPAWSADSKMIAVALDGVLHSVNIATGTSQVLSKDVNVTYPYDWSPDGKYIIGSPGGGARPSLLSLEGERKVTSLLASPVAVRGFRISPDGKWVAYFMNDSGQDQVYVSAFPSMDGKRQISTSGGRYPVWRRDGRELFFVAYDSTLMTADIRTDRGFEVSFPKPLFRLNMETSMDQYAANADASQFLVSDLLTDDPHREITVVLNWPSEIKR